ncbi:MAG: ABC transporter permease [Candidatus Heimdallarchaeota archaeon]|nr:ABC transporter permease [Candidatus Heimdallarchaeota archaeon]
MSKISILKSKAARIPFYLFGIILFLNFMGLYIIYNKPMLLQLAIMSIIITLLNIGQRYYQHYKSESTEIIRKYRSDRQPFIDFKQFADLVKRQFKINKQYILASLLALILAIVVVSQIYLINTSYNQSTFDRYVNLARPSTFEATIVGISDAQIKDEWVSHMQNGFGQYVDTFGFETEAIYTYTHTTSSIILGEQISEEAGSRWVDTIQFKTYQWTEERYTFFSQFPSFNQSMPFDPNDKMLIIPYSLKFGTVQYSIENVIRNNSIHVLADDAVRKSTAPAIFVNYTYPVSNFWQPNQKDIQYLYENKLDRYKDLLLKGLYLPEGEGWNFLEGWAERIEASNRIVLNFRAKVFLKTDIYTKIPLYHDINLEDYQAKILEAIEPLRSWANQWTTNKNSLSSENNYYCGIIAPLDVALRNFQDSIGALEEFLVLVSAPLIAIAMYLVNFAVNMVQRRKEKIVSIMKTRGTSNPQLHYMFASEIFIGGLVATTTAMILSIPWTIVSLRSRDFFVFALEPIVSLTIPTSWIINVPVFGFLIAFDLHLMSILNLHNISTDTDVNDKLKSAKPAYQEIYLDVILFFLGILYWVALYQMQIGRREVSEFLIYDIGPYVLAMMMIAGPVMFQRFYYPIVAGITKIVNLIHKSDTMSLTKKNVRLHKISTSRLAALFTAGFILTILTISIPYSFNSWSEESAAYEQGAEITLEGLYMWEVDRFHYLDIPEIGSFSPVIQFEFEHLSPFQTDELDQINNFRILGVDPEKFTEVAYWEEYYGDKPLESIMEDISANKSVAMSKATSEALGMEIGSIITLPLINYDARLFELHLESTFNYFPNLYSVEPSISVYGQVEVDIYELLMSIETAESILDYYKMGYQPKIYVHPAEGYTVEETKAAIQKVFEDDPSVLITTISDSHINLFGREQYQIISSTLQGFFILSFIIVILGYTYFIFLNIYDRKSEIGLYRVLGMSKGQIWKLLFTEASLIASITIIVGILIGGIISSNFFLVITNESRSNIPPIKFLIDLSAFSAILGALLIVTLIAAYIPAYLLGKRQTGGLLRSL